MPHLLSQEVRDRIVEFQSDERGILLPLEGHMMPSQVLMVMCADGHQLIDKLGQHILTSCKHCLDGNMVFHLLTDHGGAAVIPRHSPLGCYGDSERLIRKIGEGLKLKDLKHVALYVHVPCGAAALHEVDFIELLLLLAKAKRELRAAYPWIQKIGCYLHVDERMSSERRSIRFSFSIRWLRWHLGVIARRLRAGYLWLFADQDKRTYFFDVERFEDWTLEHREVIEEIHAERQRKNCLQLHPRGDAF
ncbi:MAG TPA: hypothetical protein VLB83_04855 [Candidatus Paceibacterota bacterium]|nr:hypothetical protein [Candidatus Paceibacterota bacterium]